MPVFEDARWRSSGAAATVTWSFASLNYGSLGQTYSGYRDFDSSINPSSYATIRQAFAAWSAVANINFIEVADSVDADIRVGNVNIDGRGSSGGSILAKTLYWTVGGYLNTAEIVFDVDAYDGNNLYETAVHEIGHAIGLGHSPLVSAVMYHLTTAQNLSGALSSDDVLGVTTLYGARGATGPVQSDDFAASTLTAGAITPGTPSGGVIEVTGDVDWFRVNLIAGHSYRMEALGASTVQGTLPDPVLEVKSSTGTTLVTFDDGGVDRNSSGTFVAPTSGVYYLAVSSYSTAQVRTGSYRVAVSDIATAVVDDFAATTLTTGVVAVGASTQGTIGGVGDVDWFRVALTAGHTYQVQARGASSGNGTLEDPVLTVLSSAGLAVATFDDGGVGLDSNGSFTPSTSGTYYLSVQSYAGADSLTGTYRVALTDLSPTSSQPSAAVIAAGANILRQSSTVAVTDLAVRVGSGELTLSNAVLQVVAMAKATTSVATLSYEFFTNKIPSLGGIDYLVSPTGSNLNNLNSSYYQNFGLENRYINFAVNLGKLGEGSGAFAAKYAALSLFEATRQAYATIFGEAPSDAKLHAILDPSTVLNGQTFTRASYFAYYGQDGESGIGAKAAMVGYLLGEAVKADVGIYAKSNDAFLVDLADGASFAVDLVGVYGQPSYIFHPG